MSVERSEFGSTADAPSEADRTLVGLQVGRPPRAPWRVAERCDWGKPIVIVSPARLNDGSLFPTMYWLTCPVLVERAGELESAGEARRWTDRVSHDSALAAALLVADHTLRSRRAGAGRGGDPCAEVGLGGQKDPLKVKCLHAHVAYALAGIEDPIGVSILARAGYPCEDDRCERLRE